MGKEHWPPRSDGIRECVVGCVLGERDVLKPGLIVLKKGSQWPSGSHSLGIQG